MLSPLWENYWSSTGDPIFPRNDLRLTSVGKSNGLIRHSHGYKDERDPSLVRCAETNARPVFNKLLGVGRHLQSNDCTPCYKI